MPRDKDKVKQPRKAIAEEVSALASLAQPAEASEEDYRLESVFLDQLRQQLNYEKELQEFQEQQDRHEMRKSVLGRLFLLTSVWLFIVIIFVAWTALSPSVQDREKLFQLQSQAASVISFGTNLPPQALMRTVSPKFCPILFHLSDSVLVAFITSTTVAVLGLFLTAAKWLYGASADNNAMRADAKRRARKTEG